VFEFHQQADGLEGAGRGHKQLVSWRGGGAETRDWKTWDWKTRNQIAGVENWTTREHHFYG